MAFSNGYIFGFAGVICLVCSVSLAGVSLALRDQQALNRERDLHKNILMALDLVKPGEKVAGEQIDTLWAERVEQHFLTANGTKAGVELDQDKDGDLDQVDVDLAADAAGDGTPALLSVFVRKDGASVGAIAMPLNGKGLWGPVYGYLALDPTATKVVGATFAGPKETPGLGAEIQEQKFIGQWKGKSLVKDGKPSPVRVVKGEAAALCPDNIDGCVDGVSGATITSRGVDNMVVAAVRFYEPFLKNPNGALQ